MTIRIHPHAQERMRERGATEEEVLETVKKGERFTEGESLSNETN